MYEFILYNRGSSHMVTGDSLKLADYPGVEPGTSAFDAASGKMYLAIEDEFVEVAAAAEETTPDEETSKVEDSVVEDETTESEEDEEVVEDEEASTDEEEATETE